MRLPHVPLSGCPQRGRRNVWVPISICALIGLLVLGLVVDFIPAIGFRDRRAAILFGAIGLWLAALLYRDKFRRERTNVRRVDWKIWLWLPWLAAMLGIFVWVVLIKAVPWTITRAFGSDHQLQATMQTQKRMYSRTLCDHRLTGGPVMRTFPPFICIDPDFYQRYPDQAVTVEFRGKTSPLGLAIISVHHVTPAGHVHAD